MSASVARDVYDAQLVLLEHEGSIRRVARAVWAAVAAWPPGLIPLPTVAHLVITDRPTGRTVYRRPVDSGEASGILPYVHGRMAEETPEQFLANVGSLYFSPVAGSDRT